MAYGSIGELPERIREYLPARVQGVFLEAYNNAWFQFDDPELWAGDFSREKMAERQAWSEVKYDYEAFD